MLGIEEVSRELSSLVEGHAGRWLPQTALPNSMEPCFHTPVALPRGSSSFVPPFKPAPSLCGLTPTALGEISA